MRERERETQTQTHFIDIDNSPHVKGDIVKIISANKFINKSL